MNDPPPNPDLPPALAARIDAICDLFEKAWQAAAVGPAPPIEDYLKALPETERPLLLQELILLDAHYRSRRGEQPRPEDYFGRFPMLDRQWLACRLPDHLPTKDAPAPASTADRSEDAETPPIARLRCPHCQNLVQLSADEDADDDVLCPACGSSFRIRDARPTHSPAAMRSLGKFQLLQRVGKGAFGAVWKARDTTLDRIVALKIPNTGLLTAAEELERFQREARATAQLRHPGIVPVHDVVMQDGLPVIVAEFVSGATLQDYLKSRRAPAAEAAALLAEIAEALHYAHCMGVIHRDLKPANIMLSYDGTGDGAAGGAGRSLGRPRVMDFGLARRPGAEATLTQEGHVVGTAAYMSPEQARGQGHQADARSDVYSLGVILYEMLCGQLPFRGEFMMILVDVQYKEPPPPRRLNRALPRDLETICLKAMAKDPGKRYATAGELAEDLRRFLRGEPVLARPVGSVARAWRWCRRNPVVAWQAAVLVVLLLALAVAGPLVAAWQFALRKEADDRASDAEKAEEKAQRERHLAQEREQEALRNFYHGQTTLADLARESRDLVSIRQALAPLRPQDGQDDLRSFDWYYLWGQGIEDPVTMVEHLPVRRAENIVAALAPDGRAMAVAYADGDVQLWDTEERKLRATLKNPRGSYQSLAFAPDSRTLAVATSPARSTQDKTSSNTLQLWDVASCKEISHIRLNPSSGRAPIPLAFAPDGKTLAVGERGESPFQDTIRFCQLPGLQPRTVPGLKGALAVASLAFSQDGSILAIGSRMGGLKCWNLATQQEVMQTLTDVLYDLEPRLDRVHQVAFAPGGESLAVVGSIQQDLRVNVVCVVDLRTGKPRFRHIQNRINAAAFSSDGRRLITGSGDGSIKVWDVGTGRCEANLRGPSVFTPMVGFLPDGNTLVSCDRQGVRLWDLATPPERRIIARATEGVTRLMLQQYSGAVTSLAFSPDGRTLATASDFGNVILCDLRSGDRRVTRIHTDAMKPVLAFSPDGRLFMAGHEMIERWDLPGDEKVKLPGVPRQQWPVGTLATSPDGQLLAFPAGYYQQGYLIRLWDAKTLRERATLEQNEPFMQATSLAFAPEGRLLAVALNLVRADASNRIKVWDVSARRLLASVDCEDSVHSVAFAPDGRTLAWCDQRGQVVLWDVASQTSRATLRGHTGSVAALAFSGDRKLLASGGSDDLTVKLWDVATCRERLTLRGLPGGVTSLAFSSSDQTLAAGCADGSTVLWQAASR